MLICLTQTALSLDGTQNNPVLVLDIYLSLKLARISLRRLFDQRLR